MHRPRTRHRRPRFATPTRLTVALAIASGFSGGFPGQAAPLRAQARSPEAADHHAYWLHLTPAAGALAISRPDDGGGAVAALQLEGSHSAPVGIGVSAGYWFPSHGGISGPDGPFGELLFVYRFHLRAGGTLAPYAGPLVGAIRDDTGSEREVRGFFGGRAGLDVPTANGWPALRLEASYRHLGEAAGRGAGDTALLLLGARWSVPVTP